jgi:di/tricarboxylate transporter
VQQHRTPKPVGISLALFFAVAFWSAALPRRFRTAVIVVLVIPGDLPAYGVNYRWPTPRQEWYNLYWLG